jgi:hypothetical protein
MPKRQIIMSCFDWIMALLCSDFNIWRSADVLVAVAQAADFNRLCPAITLNYKTPAQIKITQGF